MASMCIVTNMSMLDDKRDERRGHIIICAVLYRLSAKVCKVAASKARDSHVVKPSQAKPRPLTLSTVSASSAKDFSSRQDRAVS